jgi:hypothetical protein
MMGSRGYKGGDECDAFSRRSRRLLNWRKGELRLIKRRFWKRDRKAAHQNIAAISRGPDAM